MSLRADTRTNLRHPQARRALLLALVLAPCAFAIINPNFTPIHLVKQADTILVVSLKAGGDANEWEVNVIEVLKGETGEAQTLGLSACKEGQLEQVRQQLTRNAGERVLFFAANLKGGRCGFLHVDGLWLKAKAAANGGWSVSGIDQNMDATFAGGTDMLERMVRYILAHPDADVPVSAGTSWMYCVRTGRVEGRVHGMAVVELEEGEPLLFVAADAGDRLFRPFTGEEGEELWQDVTAAAKLDARSLHFAWVDIDRDGFPDLVNWDGEAVNVRLVRQDGTLAAPDAKYRLRLDHECLGLDPLAAPDGGPGLLLSAQSRPVRLAWQADHGWEQTSLPSGGTPDQIGGPACRGIVADLDNDGFCDVLQPCVGGGLLWRGGGDGFARPVRSPVAAAGRSTCFALGDFDTDGFLDVFAGGSDANRLWENDGKGGFRGVSHHAGSISYKCPAGVSGALATDINHDGRPDLALFYSDCGLIYHFNRGYRAFGDIGELHLPEIDEPPQSASFGVTQSAVYDFNDDGVDDLAVAFVGGDLYCYYNDLNDAAGVKVRLRKGLTGPLTVSIRQGRENPLCVGTHVIDSRRPARFLSLRRRGEFTMRWRLPGRPEQAVQLETRAIAETIELPPE